MLIYSNMHLKFMAMCYVPGANLHAELDHVCVKYETLLNTNIAVTDNDYRTLMINFLPSYLASFIAQISVNMKAIAMVQHTASMASTTTPIAPLDPKLLEMSPESMMTLALKEYDHQADKKNPKPKNIGVTVSTMASEKPGSRISGGRSSKGKGPQKPKGVCWNCGGKGHKSDVCPTPKTDEKSRDQRSNDPKWNGKPKPGPGSSNTVAANTAASATLNEVAGAWSTFKLYNNQYEDPVYNGSLWELVLPHSL